MISLNRPLARPLLLISNLLSGAKAGRRMSSSTLSNIGTARATFGNGCFWGTQNYFVNKMHVVFPDSIVNVDASCGKVGFMGPRDANPNPTYKQVCTGNTKYVEAFDFSYSFDRDENGDSKNNNYEKLVKFFFMMHDPTTFNSQGNDKGPQYASKIYCHSDDQYNIATKVFDELQLAIDRGFNAGYKYDRIVTSIEKNSDNNFIFFEADEDHQRYLEKNPFGYCNHFIRFPAWPVAPSKTVSK